MQPKGRFSYGMQYIVQDGTFRPKVLGVEDPAGDGVGGARVFIFGNANGTPIDDYAFDSGDGLQFDAGLAVVNFNYGFNVDSGAWDAVGVFPGDQDNIAAPTAGLVGNASFPLGLDSSGTYDRIRSEATSADAIATRTAGNLTINSYARVFNGATFDRGRSLSAANVSATTQLGVTAAAPPGNWSVAHTPAANTQATITRAAGAAGVRHVCTSISARLIADAASTSGVVQVNLRDGATGAGTILWSETLQVGGAASITAENAEIKLSGLSIFGSAATAMTLEFSAAGGAGTIESVAMTGYDVA